MMQVMWPAWTRRRKTTTSSVRLLYLPRSLSLPFLLTWRTHPFAAMVLGSALIKWYYATATVGLKDTQRHQLMSLTAIFTLNSTIAGVFWLIDQFFCSELHNIATGNPQFHAVWHLLCAFNVLLTQTFAVAIRQWVLGNANCDIEWKWHVLPFCTNVVSVDAMIKSTSPSPPTSNGSVRHVKSK